MCAPCCVCDIDRCVYIVLVVRFVALVRGKNGNADPHLLHYGKRKKKNIIRAKVNEQTIIIYFAYFLYVAFHFLKMHSIFEYRNEMIGK